MDAILARKDVIRWKRKEGDSVDDQTPLGDMVQSAGAISGIALVLAAILKEEGWQIGGVHVIPIAFLMAGIEWRGRNRRCTNATFSP